MQSLAASYKELDEKLKNNTNEAFKHHNMIMRELESYGFKPNPKQTIFPHNNFLDVKTKNIYHS